MNGLIRCITCNEIFLKTLYDQWPEYDHSPGLFSEPLQTVERDDYKDFLRQHQNHLMEDLEILQDSFVSEKPYSEPTKVSYFKVTNGKEKFVVKKYRTRIDEPLTYQLIPGDYSLKLLRLEAQSKEIRKQLEREMKDPPLSPQQLEAFHKLFQKVLKMVDIKDLERVPEDSSHPLEAYYKMDEVSLAYLMRNCRNIFKGREYQEVEAFIHRHRDDGVLLLKATYQIQFSELAQKKKAVIPLQQAVKEKQYVEKA
jgi:hypothetical protein